QGRELVPGGQAKKAKAVILTIADDGGRDFIDRVFGDLLLVDQKVVGFERKLVGNLGKLLEQLPSFAAVLEIQLLGKMHQLDGRGHWLEAIANFLHIRIAKQSHGYSLTPYNGHANSQRAPALYAA